MPKTSEYERIKHVVHLSTHESIGCPHEGCRPKLGDDFDGWVNHFINDHGYVLLHVGSEACRGDDGKLWNGTVAVLGSRVAPKAKRGPVVRTRKRVGVQPLNM